MAAYRTLSAIGSLSIINSAHFTIPHQCLTIFLKLYKYLFQMSIDDLTKNPFDSLPKGIFNYFAAAAFSNAKSTVT